MPTFFRNFLSWAAAAMRRAWAGDVLGIGSRGCEGEDSEAGDEVTEVYASAYAGEVNAKGIAVRGKDAISVNA